VFDLDVSTISEFTLPTNFFPQLSSQETIVQASHPDVVLYALNANNQQVASNLDAEPEIVDLGTPGRTSRPSVGLSRPLRLNAYTRSLRIVAWLPGSATTVDLLVDGRVARSRIAVGGVAIQPRRVWQDLSDIGPQVVEVGQRVNGATRAVVYALDCKQRVLTKNVTAGVGNMPRLQLPEQTCSILIGSLSPRTGGALTLYINDVLGDRDGDGLGPWLESSIGTCDRAQSHDYCDEVFNLRDSDHDGLSDREELLGMDTASGPLLLSRWGANPLHKDLFVEIDYKYQSAAARADKRPYFTAEAAQASQERFNRGSAGDLRNPDGRDGISLHFDSGVDAQPESTLYGNWGGSNEVPDLSGRNAIGYRQAWDDSRFFAPSRKPVFRYALMGVANGGGAGNAVGSKLGWSGSISNPRELVMTHELGHTLGLVHHGNPVSRGLNCNPVYKSIMNYLYSSGSVAQFSKDESAVVLNSAQLDETETQQNDLLSVLGNSPFHFPSNEYGGVDWNRDGIVSKQNPVRYPASLAGDCGTIVKNEQNLKVLGTDFESEDTPALTYDNYSGRLLAAWIQNGEILYRTALTRNDTANGSCTSGQELGNRECLAWSNEQRLQVPRVAQHVDIFSHNGTVVVAYITDQDQLMVGHYLPDSNGDLTVLLEPVTVSGMASAFAPEIALLPGNSATPKLSILVSYIGGGHLKMAQFEQEWSVSNVIGLNSTPIFSSSSPSIATWPGAIEPLAEETIDGACMSVTDVLGRVAIYCRYPGSIKWIDVSESAFSGYSSRPVSETKTAFVFYRPRQSNGQAIEPVNWSRGEFWLMTTREDQSDTRWKTRLHRSQSLELNEVNPELMRFNHSIKRRVGGSWTSTVHHTGISLVEHAQIGALKGLIFRNTKRGNRPAGAPVIWDKWLQLLPFADGTVESELRDFNDFRVMEVYLCKNLRGEAFCGDWDDSYWTDYINPD